MITPSFNIAQDDDYLSIKIHAPYTNLKEVDIIVLDSVLWFYSSPYFLRIHFPCGVVDNHEPPVSFDSDSGDFEVRLTKEQAGLHFPDLDLLGTLLAPKKTQHNIKPTIEVVSGENNDGDDNEGEEDEDEWLFEQELPQSKQTISMLQNTPKYGFGNQTSGVFLHVKSEFKEIIDLPEPDSTWPPEREVMRAAEEDTKFCPDHYLADFMKAEVVQECLQYKAPWSMETPESVKLSHEEKECLIKLGNKEFLLSKEEKAGVWLSLVDIVFAYAYNHRTTMGESNVESAWTINKLSATLSWFSNFPSLHRVVMSCFRRSLTYPLYRNWSLTNMVLKDTISIFKLGRRRVLKCLLEVHALFSASELRYLLNQLYISDYCIWLQRASDSKLARLTDTLEQITISKNEVGFDLQELERAALIVQEEEEETLTKRVQGLNIESPGERSSSSDSETSSDSSTSLDSDDDSSPDC